jgi:putative tricarboxylic transport membrane protein
MGLGQVNGREDPMRGRGGRVLAALLLAYGPVGAAGCAADRSADLSGLRIMVPNAPGSGYDGTARTAAKALEDADLVRGVEVFNLPGGGGTVGVQRLVYERGNGRLMMLMGQGVVGSLHAHRANATLQDTTPIARLLEEPGILVVTPDSPYRTLGDLVAAWRADPRRLLAGGGSSPGGPDHVPLMLMARAVGIPLASVRYRQHDGGGELLTAILGKQVAFGVSGVAEYAAQIRLHQLRVLAVTGAHRVRGVDAPTLREAGIDVTFANWRGLVAPPGLSAADVTALRAAVARMRDTPRWREALEANGWTDAYLPGDDFGDFLRQEIAWLDRVMADLEQR